MNIEYKSVEIEKKDISTGERTAVIAHAVYDNIDKVGDISRKGMFNKSWQENKSGIAFYLNHDKNRPLGKVLDVWEDETKAYTKVWFGNHRDGNDALIMADEGTLKSASFGYYTVKANPLSIKGKKVRELKEVKHKETSLLTVDPANDLAGVVVVTKMLENGDIEEVKSHLGQLESLCRNSKLSDESIKSLLSQVENIKAVISKYDTVDTQLIIEPAASVEEKQFNYDRVHEALILLNTKI